MGVGRRLVGARVIPTSFSVVGGAPPPFLPVGKPISVPGALLRTEELP